MLIEGSLCAACLSPSVTFRGFYLGILTPREQCPASRVVSRAVNSEYNMASMLLGIGEGQNAQRAMPR